MAKQIPTDQREAVFGSLIGQSLLARLLTVA